jgi:hypothetical protein
VQKDPKPFVEPQQCKFSMVFSIFAVRDFTMWAIHLYSSIGSWVVDHFFKAITHSPHFHGHKTICSIQQHAVEQHEGSRLNQ